MRAVLLVLIGVFGTALAGPRRLNAQTTEEVEQFLDQTDDPRQDEMNTGVAEEVRDENQQNDEDQDYSLQSAHIEDGNRIEENDDEGLADEEQELLAQSEVPVNASGDPESKILSKGKKRRKLKSNYKSKKLMQQLAPLLLIPLMIQAQIIPLMLFKLKLMAVKALMLGKAALLIILFNLARNYFYGADTMEDQYEHETLASSHYGYTGSPEYGAWINRRRDDPDELVPNHNGPFRGYQRAAPSGEINGQTTTADRTFDVVENT